MPGVRGFSGLMYLRAQYPSVPVVVVSANDDPAVIRRCMDFGASGFIPKTLGIEQMREAVKRVLGGGVWTPPDVDLTGGADAETAALMARLATLTPQQVRVLMMLSEGMLNKQIAYELGVGGDGEGACLGDPAEARRRQPDAGSDRRRQDRAWPVAAGANQNSLMRRCNGIPTMLRTPPATRRCTRHCAISARSAAGLSGLLQHLNVLLARGVAHMRRTVGGDQDRRQFGAEPAAQLDDGIEAVAAVEMIIDQKAVGRGLRLR